MPYPSVASRMPKMLCLLKMRSPSSSIRIMLFILSRFAFRWVVLGFTAVVSWARRQVVIVRARTVRSILCLSFGRVASSGSLFLLTANDLRFNWRKFRQNLLQLMTSTVIYEGELRTVATHLQSATKIETDAPTDNQGKGERFSPTDLVSTALATCMVTTMAIKTASMGIELKGTTINVKKHMLSDPRMIGAI